MTRRKRSVAAAVMALPRALGEAVQTTLPHEILEALSAQQALEVGMALETAARTICGIIDQKGASDGKA